MRNCSMSQLQDTIDEVLNYEDLLNGPLQFKIELFKSLKET